MNQDGQQYRTIDKFDRMLGSLKDLPDVTHSKPSTLVITVPLVGDAQTFIIQTYRQREVGDTIFLQCAAADGLVRLYIPPAAADALTTKVRKRVGKEQAEARKARGEQPGFTKARAKK